MFLPALLAGAGIAGSAEAASLQASPRIRVSADGACPTAGELRGAFSESRLAVSDDPREATWLLASTRDDATHTSRLVLRSADGSVAFEREVQGNDCHGIAGAAAVIVEAYFTQNPDRSEPPPKPVVAPPKVSPTRLPSWWLSVGVAGGGALYAQPALAAWSGEASLAARHRHWETGVGASYASPTTQHGGLDRVERTELGLHLDALYRVGSEWLWIEPGVALFLLSSRVTAPDLPGAPPVTRVDFGAGGLAVGGLRLASFWSLTASASVAFLVRRDQYAIVPSGVIARSPGERFFLGVGLRFELPLSP